MKKLLIIMLATALLPLSLFGEVKEEESFNIQAQVNEMFDHSDMKVTKQQVTDFIKKSEQKAQAIEFTDLVNVQNLFNHYYGSTPVAYEPNSNTFAFIRYVFDRENEPRYMGVEMTYTQDMGESWDSEVIYRYEMDANEDMLMIYPSFAMMNPDKSNDIEDFYYFVYGQIVDLTKEEDQFTTSRFALIEPGFQATANDFDGPEGYPKYRWYNMPVASHTDQTKVHAYGRASIPDGADSDLPIYAHAFIDIENFQLTSGVPSTWQNSNFRQSPEGSYNAPVMVDMDDQGNVYAVFNNTLPDLATNTRLISMSKSTDDGQSWSELDILPVQIFEDFLLDNGGIPSEQYSQQRGSNAYAPKGFKVYGENQFSVLYHLRLYDGDEGHPAFVEVNYDNGNWTMRRVADWSDLRPYVLSDENDDDQNFLGDFYSSNARGNEIQLATTKDGQHLVAKWIDHNENFGDDGSIELSKDLNVYYTFTTQEGQSETRNADIEELPTTDIYFAYRKIDENKWSKRYNVTNDLFFNKTSWMPDVVPSINEVPMISNKTFLYESTDRNAADYEELTFERIVSEGGTVRFSKVNITESSVKDLYSEDIQAKVYPNPAHGQTTIEYEVNEPAHIGVTLYDANGEKAGVIQNSKLQQPGNVKLNFNADKLNTGTYFFKVEINGNHQVGKFQVVK